MWEKVIRVFEQAAWANRASPLRRGNVVCVPTGCEMIIAGDLHGHGANLLRIQALAGELGGTLDGPEPGRHVVLQELIHPHGEQLSPAGQDGSHHVLTRAVRWQLQFPGRVHVILGNHELAQMTGQDILKGGASVNQSFVDSVRRHYRDEADDVLAAMNNYFASLPLAVRRNSDLAVVHSLPADRQCEQFDATVFDRPIRPDDLTRTGPAYQLVWGRTFGRPAIDRIRQALRVSLLIVGHQPQPTGVTVLAPDAMIIASDHDHGVALKLGPSPVGSADDLARSNIVQLASVQMPS